MPDTETGAPRTTAHLAVGGGETALPLEVGKGHGLRKGKVLIQVYYEMRR